MPDGTMFRNAITILNEFCKLKLGDGPLYNNNKTFILNFV